MGDVVAVGWAYLVYRSFIRAGVLPLAIAALLTGYAVEFGQYLARLFGWRLEQPVPVSYTHLPPNPSCGSARYPPLPSRRSASSGSRCV